MLLRNGKGVSLVQKLWSYKHIAPQIRRYSKDDKEANSGWEMPIGLNTGITIYNCVANGTVPLVLPNKQLVTWYTCGPTVYDSAHIGHASCYIKMDILQRILRDQFNVNLVTAMNITDIDDKIIKKSIETDRPWTELVKQYEREFWTDMDLLNVRRPDIILRVTERIPDIIIFIQRLLEQKSAYIADDGSVYFDNKRTSGKLQNISSNELHPELLVNKKSSRDFVLWKAAKPDEPYWNVPWTSENGSTTNGRPGWHTECSAMASNLFGSTIDIHGGGLDLRFPHHENEENQSCTYHNTCQWVNYWLHVGQLHIDEENKMSKSLKNTISITTMLEKYSSQQFRMACLLSNYNCQMYYSDKTMQTACNIWNKITTFIQESTAFVQGSSVGRNGRQVDRIGILEKLDETRSLIETALKNDFDTQTSVYHLLNLISFVNKSLEYSNSKSIEQSSEHTNSDVMQLVQNYILKQLTTFGCTEQKASNPITGNQLIIDEVLINDILSFRESIRTEAIQCNDKKLFDICTKIREILGNSNVDVKDLPYVVGQTAKSSWTVRSCKRKTIDSNKKKD